MISNEYISDKLKNTYNFSVNDIDKISKFCRELLYFNKKNNLISKSTEKSILHRHVLDSAQLLAFFKFKEGSSLSDLGTGGGFPGLILAIANKSKSFHVKLYEKSSVKCDFLRKTIKKLKINQCKVIEGDLRSNKINSDIIVCRAFRKLEEILKISRENCKKPHKIIILKGKDAQAEVNKALMNFTFKYKLNDSVTEKSSKILIIEAY